MQKRPIQLGRPTETPTYNAELAVAFGAAVRELRTADGIAQEALAYRAGIDRSHMGKIERGQHMPNLALLFKIAKALDKSTTVLMATTEAQLEAKSQPAEPAGES